MRLSRFLIPTMKDDPRDADMAGHRLMIRCGMMRQAASGIHVFMPLGQRVIRKIEAIVREEMERAGGMEIHAPLLGQGRFPRHRQLWQGEGEEPFHFKDMWGKDFHASPGGGGTFMEIARRDVESYRELPLLLYGMQVALVDEPRPRGGAIRAREYLKSEAFSFHGDEKCMKAGFERLMGACAAIFHRCGALAVAGEGSPGPAGTGRCQRFYVKAEGGDEMLFCCPSCGYAAGGDGAGYRDVPGQAPVPGSGEKELVHTPGASSIESLCAMLGIEASRVIKSLVVKADGRTVMALVRGDRSLDGLKLRRHLGADVIEMASPDEIMAFTGGDAGFSGPVGLTGKTVVADTEVQYVSGGVAGANRADYHYISVEPGRDFTPQAYVPLREAAAGDGCPRCGTVMETSGAFGLGRVFQAGLLYSDALDAHFVDGEKGRKSFLTVSAALGITRLAGVLAEAGHDGDGLIWPPSIAPFQAVVMPIAADDEAQSAIAGEIYRGLMERNVDAALEDRDRRPGFKFKDADLVGYPVRIVVGRRAAGEGIVEVKLRREKEVRQVETDRAVEETLRLLAGEMSHLDAPAGKLEECPC
jgi:prolyl-tRNA synthetase